MTEWFRNTEWNKEIEDFFELKLKRARGNSNKAQYLRIQASYLLHSDRLSHVGERLMKRLFKDYPDESSSVIFGHEQLGDHYYTIAQYDMAETAYKIVVDYYHTKTRSGTTGLADIKLADLILTTKQNTKYHYAYQLITDDFEQSNGFLGMNDAKYFYALTRSRLAWQLGLKSDAKDFAKLALELSKITEPQFPRHKLVGVVNTKTDDISELMRITNA